MEVAGQPLELLPAEGAHFLLHRLLPRVALHDADAVEHLPQGRDALVDRGLECAERLAQADHQVERDRDHGHCAADRAEGGEPEPEPEQGSEDHERNEGGAAEAEREVGAEQVRVAVVVDKVQQVQRGLRGLPALGRALRLWGGRGQALALVEERDGDAPAAPLVQPARDAAADRGANDVGERQRQEGGNRREQGQGHVGGLAVLPCVVLQPVEVRHRVLHEEHRVDLADEHLAHEDHHHVEHRPDRPDADDDPAHACGFQANRVDLLPPEPLEEAHGLAGLLLPVPELRQLRGPDPRQRGIEGVAPTADQRAHPGDGEPPEKALLPHLLLNVNVCGAPACCSRAFGALELPALGRVHQPVIHCQHAQEVEDHVHGDNEMLIVETCRNGKPKERPRLCELRQGRGTLAWALIGWEESQGAQGLELRKQPQRCGACNAAVAWRPRRESAACAAAHLHAVRRACRALGCGARLRAALQLKVCLEQ
mmetsp:Transcript_64978/g.184345  ORF Transcript_64978/g.184345 Transcript_64978/m.184345 type:complete len:483 (+) Transcript_64978:3207-4655(+)